MQKDQLNAEYFKRFRTSRNIYSVQYDARGSCMRWDTQSMKKASRSVGNLRYAMSGLILYTKKLPILIDASL